MTWCAYVLFLLGAIALGFGCVHAWHDRSDIAHENTMEAIGFWAVACLLLLVAK